MELHHTGTKFMETDRLLLRPFALKDVEDFHEQIAANKEVQRYFLIPYHKTIEETEVMMHRMIQCYDLETYNWAIELKAEKKVIGVIRLFRPDNESFSGEIGYAIGPDYWNNGYASEALTKILDYLFTEVSYNRLFAGYMMDNQASKRVLEKVGMKEEGIRHQEIFWQDKFHDVDYYYLLREDYLKEKSVDK